MARTVRWSPQAVSGFEDTCNYIAKDSGHYAALFAGRVNAIVKALPEYPEAGRVVPEYGDEKLREKI